MPKYFVVFTEESTKDHGYYIEAESRTGLFISRGQVFQFPRGRSRYNGLFKNTRP